MEITVEQICYAFQCSTKTFYKIFPRNQTKIDDIIPKKRSNRCITTIDEEQSLLSWIEQEHLHMRCPTKDRCIDKMNEIISSRNPKLNVTKKWWKAFKLYYADIIGIKEAKPIESKRADININHICQHFLDLEHTLRSLAHPSLLVNADESGFHKRFEKGKKKQKSCILQKC